jgi:hypothetical protein
MRYLKVCIFELCIFMWLLCKKKIASSNSSMCGAWRIYNYKISPLEVWSMEDALNHFHIQWQNMTIIVPWPFQQCVCWISNQFWKNHFNKWNIPKYSLLTFTIFFDLEKIKFENFNIFENNIINVELAKGIRVLWKTPNVLINLAISPWSYVWVGQMLWSYIHNFHGLVLNVAWFKSNPHSLNQGLTIGQWVIFHALNLKLSILPSSPSNERLTMVGLLKCEGQLIQWFQLLHQ